MLRTRVKICGVTQVGDALLVADCGADAIGWVFYPPSPRAVEPAAAAAMAAALPPFVTTVGLFVDAAADWIHAVLRQVPLDLLQFHGDEPPDFCERFQRPYIKAVKMAAGVDLLHEQRRFRSAKALLLDTFDPERPGGTGRTFDWTRIPAGLSMPYVIAGGLDAGNVAAALRATRAFAVDVSGGVEARKGVKDAGKITAFMKSVRRYDEHDSDTD